MTRSRLDTNIMVDQIAIAAPRTRARGSLITSSDPGGVVVVTTEQMQEFQAASASKNTRRGYRTHWKAFETWCAQRGLISMPAEPSTVGAYLTFAANIIKPGTTDWYYSTGTLGHWLASINSAHDLRGYARPGQNANVKRTIAGIRNTRHRPPARKAPLMLNELKRTLSAIDINSWPHGVIGHRDSALLMLGFAGAYRRSELADLQLGDVRIHPEDGLHLYLRQSKTDQTGQGAVKGIPYGANPLTCGPCAFARWVIVLAAAENGRVGLLRALKAASTDSHVCREPLPDVFSGGPLFRPVMKNGTIAPRSISGNVVNDVVKRRIGAVGLSPSFYGAHSLRAGFVTQSFRAGATHHEVMRQTGHKDVSTLELYSRENAPLAHNSVTRLGL